MGYLEEFGFIILRLKDERAENEFVLYNKETQDYSFLNEKRIIRIMMLEFRDKGIDLREFGMQKLGLDYKNASPSTLITLWLEEEIKLVNGIGFKPNKELVFDRNGKKYFNTFINPKSFDSTLYSKPLSFEEFKEKAPYHYKLLFNLHNFDDEAIKDTLMKIADKIKYPDQKAGDCIVFYPGEGSGKGIFYKFILEPLFKDYASKVLMRRLHSDFNAFLRTSLVLALEEGKRDLELVETLKEIITESSILINEKGKNQKEEEIYFLTFVFSNNMNPIDLGKRRGSYHLTHSLGKTIQQSQEIGKEICDNLPNETEFLLQYLHGLEFEHQTALMPFNTKAKTQVTDLNKSPLELFYDELISYDSLDKALIDLNNKRGSSSVFEMNIETFKPFKGVEDKYISKDILKDAYNNFCHIEGLRHNIIRHNKDIVQLWALMKIPEDAHQRIVVKNGRNIGRKLDHIRLRDIQTHIQETNQNE